ncbi:MAG: hypothetical protein ACHQJX_05985 [Candidatus Acidiferrales bacterium]
MKKAIVGLAVLAVLAGMVLVSVLSHPSQKVTATVAKLDQEHTQIQVKQEKAAEAAREPGTVAFWDAMDAMEEDKWLDSEYDFMRTVVGPIGEDTEKWLGLTAPDLVYVEASKCGGNLRPSESVVCEERLGKKFKNIFDKCNDLRPSDQRSCVVGMDPEMEKQEKAEWEKVGK